MRVWRRSQSLPPWQDNPPPPPLPPAPPVGQWIEVGMEELQLGAVIGEGAFGKVHVAAWRGQQVSEPSELTPAALVAHFGGTGPVTI